MKIIGHRGARGLAPENTIAALKKGVEHKADLLEFDLRVTKDNVVILHHDKAVSDASGKRLLIKDHSYSELKDHKPDLATFEEVLKTISPKQRLYVEIKPREPLEQIVRLIKKYLKQGWPAKSMLLASKHQPTLVALHQALPELQTLVIEPWSGVRAHRRAKEVGTNIIAMNKLWLWFGFIWSVSRSGTQLYAYTLNDPGKAKRWQRWGLAGVVTDYPDRFER
jgi:glycerophosphoryl diester phosphodiesterase